jgi:3-isopropylmalate/(R)-2-methylmalate dehydratase small subunit
MLSNTSTLTIDVDKQTIIIDATGETETFDINNYKKTCLINGFDDIDYLINIKDEITAFEKQLEAP